MAAHIKYTNGSGHKYFTFLHKIRNLPVNFTCQHALFLFLAYVIVVIMILIIIKVDRYTCLTVVDVRGI